MTRLEDAVLTPKYAAPEQLLGDAPTTATDVYQLGTLLYVLLTGHHPQAATRSRTDGLRATLESGTVPASHLASGAARKILRGDLDAILAVALRVEAAERYATAQAFKEDLQRYLSDEPVLARSGATAYRIRKFVNRHLLAVLVSTTAVAGLCAALVFALFEGRNAEQQRDVALRELARANTVNDFTAFLLSVAAPGDARFTAAELLEQSEHVIDKQFAHDQPLKAELLTTVGVQYMQSERWGDAESVLGQSAALAEKAQDPSLKARAYCPLALVKMLNGERERAETLMTQALATLPERPEYAQLRAECETRFAEFGYFTGDGRTMIDHATRALGLLQNAPSASPVRRIDAQSALAYGHYLAQEDEAADRLFASAMSEFEKVGRERTIAAADVLNNWALVHYRGDIRKAEPLLRRALEVRRSAEGSGGVAPTLSYNYAGVLLRLGRFAEAVPMYEETIRTSAARQENRIMFDAMMELAELRIESGELQEAERQLSRLIPHMSHPRFDRNRRAQLAYYQGHLAEERGSMRTACERYAEATKTFDEIPEKIALNVDALAGLARCELAAGNSQAGTQAAQHALELAQTLGVPNVPSYLLGTALLAVGDTQLAAGNLDSSRSSYQQALSNLQETLGPEHAQTEKARVKAER
jgi:serine/threonine-protein kinase